MPTTGLATRDRPVTEWFRDSFGEDYLRLYPHRNDEEAERITALIVRTVGLEPGWRVLDVACGAGRHARAFRRVGAECVGLDLSAVLLRVAQATTDAWLVRADMRRIPVRPCSMHLVVNLFTSFGYFERDEEHALALTEMTAALRPGGWFVIDFLNPAAVRAGLVPRETVALGDGEPAHVTRSMSPDGRHVIKTIDSASRSYVERVRLFRPDEMTAMLEARGIAVSHRFGDYDAGRPSDASPRSILMGRSPA